MVSLECPENPETTDFPACLDRREKLDTDSLVCQVCLLRRETPACLVFLEHQDPWDLPETLPRKALSCLEPLDGTVSPDFLDRRESLETLDALESLDKMDFLECPDTRVTLDFPDPLVFQDNPEFLEKRDSLVSIFPPCIY